MMIQRLEEVLGEHVWEEDEESIGLGFGTGKDVLCSVFVYVMAVVTGCIHTLRVLLVVFLTSEHADTYGGKRTRTRTHEESTRPRGEKTWAAVASRRDEEARSYSNSNESTGSGMRDIIRVIFNLKETLLVRDQEEEEEEGDNGRKEDEEDEAAATEEMLGQGRGREFDDDVASLSVEQCIHLLTELEHELARRGARIAELEETEDKNLQIVEKGIRAMKDAYGASLEEFERELIEAESRWTRTFDEMEVLGRERVDMLSKALDRATVEAETKDRLVAALREDVSRVETELEDSKRDLRVSALGISESARLVAGLRVRVEDAEILKKSAQMTLEVVSHRCAEIGKERDDLRSSIVQLTTRIAQLESASLSLSHNASHTLSRIERERELLDMQRREQEYRTPQRGVGQDDTSKFEYVSSSVGTGGDDNGSADISTIVVSHEKALGAAHAALVSELKEQLADQKRLMDDADADFRAREAELRARLRQAWTDEEEMRIERDAAVEAMAAESKKDEAIRVAMASSLSTSDLDFDIADLPTPVLNVLPSPTTSVRSSPDPSPPSSPSASPDIFDRVQASLRLAIFAIFVSLLAMVTRLFSAGS